MENKKIDHIKRLFVDKECTVLWGKYTGRRARIYDAKQMPSGEVIVAVDVYEINGQNGFLCESSYIRDEDRYLRAECVMLESEAAIDG